MTQAEKILTVTPGLTTGGVQRISANYAMGYASAGRDSRVLTAEGGSMQEDLDAAGVPVWAAGSDPAWSQLEDVVPAIKQWSPDAVHIHAHSIGNELVIALRDICNSETVFVETNVWGSPSSFRSHLDVSCQLTTWCIWSYEQQLRAQNGQLQRSQEPLLVTVPYSVDFDTFHPSSEDEKNTSRISYGIPRDAFVMGRVGQSYPGKSHPAPLAIVRELRKRGVDAWFVSVAPSDEFRAITAAADEDIRPYVRILDRINDSTGLRKAYGSFDAFLHVTIQGETFGNVLAEAQACKIPVITRSTMHRDNSQCIVVKNGKTGFVVAKWRKLIDAAATLAADPELRAEMGEAGYDHVRMHYANDVVTRRLLTILDCGRASASRKEFEDRLIEKGILSGQPVSLQMAQYFADCYGGLPFYWALWNRLDRTTGFGFRAARKLDHWRRRLAERYILDLPKS